MTEREMEDLVWNHVERFLNEPWQQFRRQPRSSVGRADLVFTDRLGRLLIIELKKGEPPTILTYCPRPGPTAALAAESV
jgi:RecB family endonuclease NucS